MLIIIGYTSEAIIHQTVALLRNMETIMSDFREYLLPARTEAPYFDGTDQEHHGECVNLPSQVQCTESGRRRTGMRSPPATYNEGGTQPDQRFVMICGEIEARRPTPDNRFPLSILLSPQLRGRHPLLITTATATLRSTALAFLRPHSLPDILSSAPDGIPSPIHIQIRAIRRLTGALGLTKSGSTAAKGCLG